MIDPAGSGRSVDAAGTVLSRGVTRQPSQTQAFATALSGALDSQDRAAKPTPAPSSNQRASESIVTGQDSGTSTSTPASTTPSTPVSAPQQNPFEALISACDSATSAAAPAAPVSAPTAATGGTQSSQQSFDEAYWASQPAAVQQLQYVNPADRLELATQLANEGYTIDVPIMVWGWDPATTMATRQADGYTWVPSALQQPIEVAPGLTFDGQSYNPNNPPAGSITVT